MASGASSLWVAPKAGVTQPFSPGECLAACSLSIVLPLPYSQAILTIAHWDPTTLAPDPTTVALRTRTFFGSPMAYGRTRANFDPPVVTEPLAHVAEVNVNSISLDWRTTDPNYGHFVRYEPDNPEATEPALYHPPSGLRSPISGSGPTLDLSVCNGGTAYEAMRVVQAVMPTHVLQPTYIYEWAQRFRVPEPVTLDWVEIALGGSTSQNHGQVGRVAIFDAEGQSEPQFTLAGPLAAGGFSFNGIAIPVWSTHYDFDTQPQLVPGHDYWLAVRGDHYYQPYTRLSVGAETADFVTGIGPLCWRADSTTPWFGMPGHTLSFRLIGSPSASVEVAGPARRESSIQLVVAPNPTSGAVAVSWSGTVGPAHLEILDPRGRRVVASTSEQGRWMWSGRDPGGKALPPGVYFVRLRDGANRSAIRRLVLVR